MKRGMPDRMDLLIKFDKRKENSNQYEGYTAVLKCIFIPVFLYFIAVWLGNKFIPDAIWNASFMLIAYIVLLIGSSLVVWCSRKKLCEKYNFSYEELAAFYELILLVLCLCLLVSSFVEKNRDILYIVVLDMTLYVGFAVSLDKLFAAENIKDFGKCFLQPFSTLEISNFKNVIWWIVGIIMLGLMQSHWVGILILLLISTVLFAIVKIQEFIINQLNRQLLKRCQGKKVLILQTGLTSQVLKQLQKRVKNIQEICEEQILEQEYDVVIVLNTLPNAGSHMEYIEMFMDKLGFEGEIIDPFITKRGQRNYSRAWQGWPTMIPECKSVKEYKEFLHTIS